MKRLICLFLLLLLGCGAALAEDSPIRGYVKKQGYVYVALGRYPFEADGTEKPITWRVLEAADGRAYVVSEYVLINHRIHPDDEDYIAHGGVFRTTEMWDFLNGEFREAAFTDEEWACIVDTEEFGRMYLLSRDDLKNKAYGFTSDEARKAWGTPWALERMTVNEKYNRVEQALFRYGSGRGAHSPYWTRTQGRNGYSANCTKSKGQIGWIRVVVQNEGCRPACLIDLSRVEITGGTGTADDPYMLRPRE